MPLISSRPFAGLVLLAAAGLSAPCARAEDGPVVDAAQMLQQLRQVREQSAVKAKADKQKIIQEVNAAAASGESAAAAWEKAVMATKFDGVSREVTAFKAWRDTEGEPLKEPEGKNAARLYFQWLALTIQRSAGTSVKDLLPALINYTRELTNDQAAIERLDETGRREKEHGNKPVSHAADVKKMHDSILQQPLAGSVVVEWLKLAEWVTPEKWEGTPGNHDGIFDKIILPELRALHDLRVLEYYDLKIKNEGDRAARSKLAFEHDKFLTQRLPVLLWQKSSELPALGLKNRAATEMFNIIRKYPQHPEAGDWMSKLEAMLASPTAAPAPSSPAPGAVPPIAK